MGNEAARFESLFGRLGDVIYQNYVDLEAEGIKDDWEKCDSQDYIVLFSKVTMLRAAYYGQSRDRFIQVMAEMVIDLVSMATQYDMNLGAKILKLIEKDHDDITTG